MNEVFLIEPNKYFNNNNNQSAWVCQYLTSIGEAIHLISSYLPKVYAPLLSTLLQIHIFSRVSNESVVIQCSTGNHVHVRIC